MRKYEDNETEDGRKENQPHVDVNSNHNYFWTFYKTNNIKKFLEKTNTTMDIKEKNKENVVDKPINICFYWNRFETNYGISISMHQQHRKFKEELHKFFRVPLEEDWSGFNARQYKD